ncbi:hypothetical protein HYV21_00270 [Candidatus Microgenomates bacterium]|nr:hypothetical protein [Candidatus Microgenomates bacterium]
MNPLDKLSKLINISFPKLKRLGNIHIASDNKLEKITVNDNKKVINVTINVEKLESKDIAQLQAILKELVIKNDELVIEDNARKTLEDFSNVDKQRGNQSLLEYFKGKIPSRDIEILRASLYLKSIFERGEPVFQLKQDIMNRFGDRGRNISNLCTAGYFTSQIRPLYEEMYAQPNFSPEEFFRVYDIIVTESPYAVFISAVMSQEDVKREVLDRIRVGKTYGIKYLNIHGIGEDNVDKISYLLKELTPTLTQPPEITKGERFIVIKIWF